MSKKSKTKNSDCLRTEPEARLCPKFDATGIALHPVAKQEDMGFFVMDNCAEDHIM